jgi:phenylacetate-coenzyme A ligase PaaK-like adenylate-forming protein
MRYAIEDLGTYRDEDRDDSGVKAIRELHGRVASTIELPNGKVINNIFWNHLFKEVNEVQQFQVVVRTERGIRLLLKGDGFTSSRERELRDILLRFLGDLPVQIEWVDRIPLTSQGKRIQVVRERSDPRDPD